MYFDVNDETASSTQAAEAVTEISNCLNNNINSNVRDRDSASASSPGMSGEDDFISRSRLSSKTSALESSSDRHHSHSQSHSSSPLSQDINFNTSISTATSASINESQSALTQRQEPNVVNSSSQSSPATKFHNNNSSAQVCANANGNSNSDDGSSSINHTPVNTAININTTLEAHGGRENANISSKSQSQRHEPPPKLIFSSETPPPLPISHPPSHSHSSTTGSSANLSPRVEFVLGDELIDISDVNASNPGAAEFEFSGGDEMQRLLRKTSKMRHSHSSSEVMMTNGYELPGPATATSTATSTTPTPNTKPKVPVTVPVLDVNSNSHCTSLLSAEENFECLADGRDSFFDSPSENTSLQYTTARDANDLSLSELAGPSNRATPTSGLPFRRNSALRTSLRKSPQDNSLNADMGHRRWGSFRNASGTKRPLGTSTPTSSNALATQLYRTGSFNSTGRSSTGDPEEMYSDGSLEDEVIDLTQKVHHLEEKFTVLAENQSDVDDRYSRAKQENSELTTKLFLLEEQLRDVEQRAEDKIRDEQKRSKEALARLDREKQLQIENYDIRLQGLEKELQQTKNESTRQKQMLERERTERIQASDKLYETEREIVALRDDNRNLMEQSRKERESLVAETAGSQQALQDLRKEFEHLRQFQMANLNGSLSRDKHNYMHRESLDGDISEVRSRLLELEEENKQLKQQNRRLEETNEDLTAQILNHGLEEGRHLLTLGPRDMGNSLAAEFEAMSEDQMKAALKEQKEVNEQLRCYIDGILLNIVENYPQLLEVKNKSQPHDRPQAQLRQKERRES